MSKLLYVLKNRDKYEKEEQIRREEEIRALKSEGRFRVALNKNLEVIRTVLDDPKVEYVDVTVYDKDLAMFGKALNFAEFQEFRCRQTGKDVNTFRFMRKTLL